MRDETRKERLGEVRKRKGGRERVLGRRRDKREMIWKDDKCQLETKMERGMLKGKESRWRRGSRKGRMGGKTEGGVKEGREWTMEKETTYEAKLETTEAGRDTRG